MAGPEMRNMSFRNGMQLKVRGAIKPNADCFSINVGHSTENIALHFCLRFNENPGHCTFVMNSKKDDSWLSEERDINQTFKQGQGYEVCIVFNFDTFDIYLPDGRCVHFENRPHEMEYDFIFLVGDGILRSISMYPAAFPTKR